jgi:amidase
VRDAAAMLDAVEGPDVGDRYAIARPTRPFLEEVTIPRRRLRIAFSANGGGHGFVDPACANAVRRVAAQCAAMGHDVEEAAPRYDEEAFHQANLTYWASSCAFGAIAIGQLLGRTPSPENLEATLWATYQYGMGLKAMDVEMADALANQVCRSVGAFYTSYDVLLSPTMGTPPLPLGTLDANDARHDAQSWYRHLFKYVPFTALYNMTGQPAISLPLEMTPDGLPIGIQLVGRGGDEATLFGLAGQLEQAMPWHDRKPGVHASRY